MRTIVIAVVALIAGLVIGVGYGMLQVDEANQKLAVAMQERDQAQQGADRLRRTIDEASRKYGTELGKQVTTAASFAATATIAPPPPPPVPAVPPAPGAPVTSVPVTPTPAPAAPTPAADDSAKLLDQARGMLAARDGFRSPLDSARAAMNGEFDALATELGNPTPDAEKVKQTLIALKANWAAKEKAIDDATRR